MKSIYDILEAIETNHEVDMEYCATIAEVQKILTNFKNHIKPFHKIQIRQENERYLDELNRRLLSFLKLSGLVDPETNVPVDLDNHALQKVAFFLVLNTESAVFERLKEEGQLCHLVGICPKLSKCILFSCLVGLRLLPLFFDFVRFAPTWLVVEFVDADFLDSFKLLENDEARVEAVCQFIAALYEHVWIQSFVTGRTPAEDQQISQLTLFLTSVFVEHVNVAREHHPDKKRRQYDTYVGQMLRHYLAVVIGCVEAIEQTSRPSDRLCLEKLKMYQVSSGRVYEERRGSETVQDREHMSTLKEMLLDRLQVMVKSITLNTFMNWVEVDVTPTVTLQRCTGERAHKLGQMLAADCEPRTIDLVRHLKTISVKPLLFEEVAKAASIGEIIKYIEDEAAENRHDWMNEFLDRGSLVLDNEQCLATIKNHITLLSISQCRTILGYLRQHVGEEVEYFETVIGIYLQTLTQSKDFAALDWHLLAEQPSRVLTEFDVDQEPYFCELITFLNRITASEPTEIQPRAVGPFLKTFILDPKRALAVTLDACLADSSQTAFALRIFRALKGAVSNWLEEVVRELLETPATFQAAGLELLLSQAFHDQLLDPAQIVKGVLFRNGAVRADEREVLILLNALRTFLKSGATLELNLLIPALMGIGTVADKARWDMVTYSDLKARVVAAAVDLVTVITGQLLERPPLASKHQSFVETKCAAFKPLTKYYFLPLLRRSEDVVDLVKYLHPQPFVNSKQCVEFLCMTCVRCTTEEMLILAADETLQPHFVATIAKLTRAIAGTSAESKASTLSNFQHVFSTFLGMLRDSILPKLSAKTLHEFLELVKVLPAAVYEDQFYAITSIAAAILEDRARGTDEDAVEWEAAFKTIQEWPDCVAKEKLINMKLERQ